MADNNKKENISNVNNRGEKNMKAYYQDNGYWAALEKEHEAEEVAYQARKNSKGSGKA